MTHQVLTTHIQALIENGFKLARDCNYAGETVLIAGEEKSTAEALEKAAADLHHAAEELTAERLSLLGWKQV